MSISSLFSYVLTFNKDSQALKHAITIAIHETELFIKRRHEIEPTNIFGCENTECTHVAKAWRAALNEASKNNSNISSDIIERKLKFWTSKKLREEEQATEALRTRITDYLEEVRKYYLKEN